MYTISFEYDTTTCGHLHNSLTSQTVGVFIRIIMNIKVSKHLRSLLNFQHIFQFLVELLHHQLMAWSLYIVELGTDLVAE